MQESNAKRTNSGRGNSRKANIDITTISGGKIPPQAQDLERIVLGAVLIEKDAFDLVNETLIADAFYSPHNQSIYNAFCNLSVKGMPIDYYTVIEELQRMKQLDIVGGPVAITRLTNEVASTANLETHVKIIQQKYFAREIIRVSIDGLTKAFDESTNVLNLHDELEKSIGLITTKHLRGTHRETPTLIKETKERVSFLKHNKGSFTGVTTGYRPLNHITNGWQPTDLIILAARPSVGKTTFALNLARNATLDFMQRWIATGMEGRPDGVGFFSMEMSAGQLINRLIACHGEIGLEKISNGRFSCEAEYEYFNTVADKVGEFPIFIDDTPGLKILEFRSRARRLVKKHKVKLIIVDYLQLMDGRMDNDRNRESEISNISRNLKEIAKELNIPIIALSQMSRSIEREKSREPQLSDLRESGAIEQDADIVAFLTRPDYQKKDGEVDHSMKHDIKLWVKKHRNGQLEDILLRAVLSIQRCFDLEDYDTYRENLKEGTPVMFSLNNANETDDDLPF